MNLEQKALYDAWRALMTEPSKCIHHFHGPYHMRVGLGDCQCGYEFDEHSTKNFGEKLIRHHRHNFRCCRCFTEIECGLPFGEEETNECRVILEAYRKYVESLPPMGG